MYLKKIFTLLFIFSIYGNLTFAQPFELQNAFPNTTFDNPLYLTHSNDQTNRIFVVEKTGRIKVLPNDSLTSINKTYLNISDKIINGSERGLLGVAFHPNYSSNGYFFVNYTRAGDGATVVSRFNVSSSDPDKADSLSEFIILTIAQPYSNHNGGMIFFGMDGYLHIGTGDGGSGGDPGNRAQTLTELLGKILRINIDTTTSLTNYGIPPTNIFATGGGRAEIFNVGMRNPWRMSVDPVTGEIWCGDVGQDAWEEIDIIENGNNYGWRCYEGNNPFNTAGCSTITNYTFPVKVYQNVGSDCSVTGGYVYRGQRRPELYGRYIYGDYCSRKVWKLKYENGVVTEDSQILTAAGSILSWGTDQNNELYMCSVNGIVYRFNKSDLVGVNNNILETPNTFKLEQNFPNPFNPETSIKYYLPEISNVNLVVFDANGKQISTLVNTKQISGSYNIKWNGKDATGNNLPSGVYFYNLTAGNNFSQSKKMLLIK